jgi:hypothetical protein
MFFLWEYGTDIGFFFLSELYGCGT